MKDDTISRVAAIEVMRKAKDKSELHRMLVQLPSAQLAQDLTNGCTDTISRAAVVDAIEGVDWYHQNDSGEMVHGANSDEHQAWYKADDIYKAIEALPSAQPEQRWIPVTEKCPEIGQIVLCSLKARHYYGRIHVCKYCAADKYYDHPYFDWSHNGFPDVVAWMPLPEPYYPEGEEHE